MSRRDSDRAARSRGPSGDATAARDAGVPHAVADIPSAARSRFAGPSGDAPGRHPPRNARGCDRRIDAGRRQHGVSGLRDLSEAAA